MMQIAIF